MQQPVSIGATTKVLLFTFFLSLWPTIQQTIESGELPKKETLVSMLILGALGVYRTIQQMVLDKANKDQLAGATPRIGLTTGLFIVTFIGSLVPLIEQGVEQGTLPTRETIVSGIVLGGLAVLRIAQQLYIQYLHPPVVPVIDATVATDITETTVAVDVPAADPDLSQIP